MGFVSCRGASNSGEGRDAPLTPNPYIGLYTYLSVEGASISENALGLRAVVRSVVAARWGHTQSAINRSIMNNCCVGVFTEMGWGGGGSSSGLLNCGCGTGYLTTSVA